ncbi:MAG: hypothetical protein ACI8RZ_002496, partial [Myxococcota bacterium]
MQRWVLSAEVSTWIHRIRKGTKAIVPPSHLIGQTINTSHNMLARLLRV